MDTLRVFTHEIFYNFESKRFLVVNNFFALLTLVSILAIILETVHSLAPYQILFETVEYVTVFFFTLEYLGRIIANRKDALSYMFSFFGLIDLLSIVPSYVGIANLTFLKSARILRVLRLLRIIRLAKIARLRKYHSKELEDYAYLYKLNIKIYFFALLSSIVIFGTAIYVLEGDTQAAFANIPLSMIWAAKVTLGGVAQYLPGTPAGELVSIFARFVGLVLFGLLISIVGNSIRKVVFGSAELTQEKNQI